MAEAALRRVSVIVPVLNGEDTIRACVASVLGTDYPEERHEVIVVDNGSTDRTPEIVRSLPVRLVHEERRGPSHARNRGIDEANGQILAFTDADCVATRGWLRELVAGFDDERVGGVAGEILAYPPTTPAERYMTMTHPDWQRRALSGGWPFAATANVAFRRTTFARIGPFDPRLPVGEDRDLGRRFFDQGELELRYRRRAAVFHRHHATVRGFFRQHARWSYGAALLHAKYDLPWGVGDELRKYGELLRAAGAGGGAAIRYPVRDREATAVYVPAFELLRQLAHRVGALAWLLGRPVLRARFTRGGRPAARARPVDGGRPAARGPA